MKKFLKQAYRKSIRVASKGLPDVVLFHGALLLRRFGLGLKNVSAPAAAQRVADFLFYNLRHMRPGLARARLRRDKFFIQLNDPCQYDLVLGIHEPAVVNWVASNLKKGMTFFDVGTNVGYYTVLGSRLVGQSGRVIALEPNPEVLAILRRNIEVNLLGNVRVIYGAASGTCGPVKLGLGRSTSYSTGLHCEDAVDWIEVPGYSLDALANKLDVGSIELVKLDVEGAEAEAIEGMSAILSAKRPKVIMELHGSVYGGFDHPAVQKLKNSGYAVRNITRFHVVGEPTRTRECLLP